MPANSTTRRGNGAGKGPAGGAGWGGPAKGATRPDFTSDTGAAAGSVPKGQGARSVADLMAAMGARELAAQRWWEILNDPAHPHHATMVAKAADRMDGAPKQSIEVRDADPDSMTDEELAAIAAGSRRAPAGASGD